MASASLTRRRDWQALTNNFETTSPTDFSAPAETDNDPHTEGLDHALGMILDALKDGDYSSVEGEAEALMQETGAVMGRRSKEYRTLCHALLRARAESLRALLADRARHRLVVGGPHKATQ